MQVETELAKFTPEKDMLLTIGVFDGVHLGHRHLIARLAELAQKSGLSSGVITFSRHPREVLAPRTSLPFLTDIERRIELLRNEGVEAVIPLSFTTELAKLSPQEFLGLLKKHLRMRGLVIGPDFALGKNREGDTDALRQLGAEMDFNVTVVPPLTVNGEVVSSTAIRQALAEGDMKRAQKLMGRPFRLHGRVVRGDRRGVELGFPTANLDTEAEQALPADGVYTSRAYIDAQAYPAMTNIGIHPTFGSNQRLVEVYIIDYEGDLYGRELAVDIIERLRGEIKFDNPEELKKQIAEDVKRGKAILEIRGAS
ncbi:MAG: bifunctional riboflavin kinase/FAD synthetase [Dehalococcoidia bacterium]|nr:MAG: bifunctional riboflavin kinase/FAD synthetase [Dehalococcoidia bacterium]